MTANALSYSFRDIEDTLSDLRVCGHADTLTLLRRLVHQLENEPLAGFLRSVLPQVDFASWLPKIEDVSVGESLEWLPERPRRVALQIKLIQALAQGEVNLDGFLDTYFFADSRRLDDNVRKFWQGLLQPLARDIERLAEQRPLPPILFSAMGNLPGSGDAVLDDLLAQACKKFGEPAPSVRRDAIEKLWDAWERLKSLEDPSDKKRSITKLLEQAASDEEFRRVLDKESRAMTEIGNEFHIRHFEVDRHDISEASHFDYLFHRLFSLIYLLLFRRAQTRESKADG